MDTAAGLSSRTTSAGADGWCDMSRSRRSMVSRTRRSSTRLSQSFLRVCLAENDSDSDFFSLCGSEGDYESLPSTPRKPAVCFSMSDSEDDFDAGTPGQSLEDMFKFSLEDFDESQDIEELFSFDSEKVAEAYRRGAGMEEIVEIINQCQAANLEALTMPSAAQPATIVGNSLMDLSPLMAGDISGRMTPPTFATGQMTPPDTVEAAVLAGRTPEHQAVVNRLSEFTGSARKGRRSSMVQCRRLSVAVEEHCARHRQSLAQAATREIARSGEEGEEVKAEMRKVVLSAHRRCRQSISQAALVLEAAGVGEDSDDESSSSAPPEVVAKLQFMQEAVETARIRHRQSISQAVRSIADVNAEPRQASDLKVGWPHADAAVCARVEKSIAAACSRKEERDGKNGCKTMHRLVALAKTRASVAGRRVHCGPAVQNGARGKAKNGGLPTPCRS